MYGAVLHDPYLLGPLTELIDGMAGYLASIHRL